MNMKASFQSKPHKYDVQIIIVAVLIILVGLGYFLIAVSETFMADEISTCIINLVILGLMTIIVMLGAGNIVTHHGLVNLQSFNLALRQYLDRDPSVTLTFKSECSELNDAIALYHADSKKALEETGNACDIRDYVNEDLYLRIGHADFNEYIPNMLTGLGILGTFFGLALGLKDLNLTDHADQLIESVGPLIGGMKVAFYSSILGISWSVFYSFASKRLFSQADALVAQLAFQKKQAGESDVMSQIANLLAIQNKQLSNFHTELSHDIEMGIARIGEAMIQEVNRVQVQGVEQLVDRFHEHLKTNTSQAFDLLQEQVKNITDWQNRIYHDLGLTVEEISLNTSALNESFKKCQTMTDCLEQTMGRIADQQSVLIDNTHSMLALKASLNELNEAFASLFELENARNEAFQVRWAEIQKESRAIFEQWVKTTHGVEESIDRLDGSISHLNDAGEKLSEQMNGSVDQIDHGLTTIEGTFNNCLSAFSNLRQQNEVELARIQTSFDTMNESARKLVDSMIRELLALQQSCENTQQSILAQRDMQKSISKDMNASISSLTSAGNELAQVSAALTTDTKSLSLTFEHEITQASAKFEKQLGGLSNHLESFPNMSENVVNATKNLESMCGTVVAISRKLNSISDISEKLDVAKDISEKLNVTKDISEKLNVTKDISEKLNVTSSIVNKLNDISEKLRQMHRSEK